MTTPKQRMLNAYKDIHSDFIPVAPEFWFFYPAKVLGITMVEFQRDYPHWKGMLATFKKYHADGWGIASADVQNPNIQVISDFKQTSENEYLDTQTIKCKGAEMTRKFLYHKMNPFWVIEFPAKNEADLKAYMDAYLADNITYDFAIANQAHKQVGESFLLEFDLGLPFFDFIEEAMGFEEAIMYIPAEESEVQYYANKYLNFKINLLRQAINNTEYEAYFIGCSSSCNSLLGPNLWRKWDKPYLKAMTEEVHKHGKLIHNHNHGKIMQTVIDLVDIGYDCVCPFERAPGDVDGIEGLKAVRKMLQEKVTFNGNVHTVKALAKGTPEIVREQVREIKEAFKGSPRLIIGTGDQVPGETPEDNIYAMIEEGRKK